MRLRGGLLLGVSGKPGRHYKGRDHGAEGHAATHGLRAKYALLGLEKTIFLVLWNLQLEQYKVEGSVDSPDTK